MGILRNEQQAFEWDDEKNQLNLRKHGIRFETAMYIFRDSNRIELYDEEHSEYEDRYLVIGQVHKILVVVYTERGKNIRIISARKATSLERSLYYDRLLHFKG